MCKMWCFSVLVYVFSKLNRHIEEVQRRLDDSDKFITTSSSSSLHINKDETSASSVCATAVKRGPIVVEEDDEEDVLVENSAAIQSDHADDELLYAESNREGEARSDKGMSLSLAKDELCVSSSSSTLSRHQISANGSSSLTENEILVDGVGKDLEEEKDEDGDWESGSDASSLSLTINTTKQIVSSSLSQKRDDLRFGTAATPNHDNNLLDRAVVTASHMAGWAADAVKKALRPHLMSSQFKPSGVMPAVSLLNQYREASPEESKPNTSAALNLPASPPQAAESIIEEREDTSRAPDASPSPFVSVTGSTPLAVVDTLLSLPPHSQSHSSFISSGSDATLFQEILQDKLRASRDVEVLTMSMKQQVMDLLELMRVPFIVATEEAEAACCVLEQMHLVDGIVTEDSVC